jgi:hypothetical protein
MPTVQGAFDYLQEHGHEHFGNVGSMVYVGHRHDTHPWWRTRFAAALGNPLISIVDIQQCNLDSSKPVVLQCVDFILGDICDPNTLQPGYGLVFWDEGPEHVAKKKSLETIKMLIEKNMHVLISCPWGYQQQGTDSSDPEFHHWAPMPADFLDLSMKVLCFGEMFPEGHGNLIAWT